MPICLLMIECRSSIVAYFFVLCERFFVIFVFFIVLLVTISNRGIAEIIEVKAVVASFVVARG